jgi:hypothetical protein
MRLRALFIAAAAGSALLSAPLAVQASSAPGAVHAATSWSCGSTSSAEWTTPWGQNFTRDVDNPLGSTHLLGRIEASMQFVATAHPNMALTLLSVSPAPGWSDAVVTSTPHIVVRFISGVTSVRVRINPIHWNGATPTERLVEQNTTCTQ